MMVNVKICEAPRLYMTQYINRLHICLFAPVNDDNVYILSPPLVNQLLRDERLLTARENAAGEPRAPGCSLTFPTWISDFCTL